MVFEVGHVYAGRPPVPLPERFWPKVDKEGGPVHPLHGRCWIWTARIHPTGYGQFKLGNNQVHAHRVAWLIERGEIPMGLWVLHRCDNPRCVNPAHLFLGTVRDNVADMIAKGRHTLNSRAALKKMQKECIEGHPFDAANTARKVNGTRRCRKCDAARARDRRAAATASGQSLDAKSRPKR